ncbi:MAG TPA: hypothetical protein VHZ29_14860 [Rhizomicrobium sp.]|nr:hypothetical protein [Rhizomicrobium sp.]
MTTFFGIYLLGALVLPAVNPGTLSGTPTQSCRLRSNTERAGAGKCGSAKAPTAMP